MVADSDHCRHHQGQPSPPRSEAPVASLCAWQTGARRSWTGDLTRPDRGQSPHARPSAAPRLLRTLGSWAAEVAGKTTRARTVGRADATSRDRTDLGAQSRKPRGPGGEVGPGGWSSSVSERVHAPPGLWFTVKMAPRGGAGRRRSADGAKQAARGAGWGEIPTGSAYRPQPTSGVTPAPRPPGRLGKPCGQVLLSSFSSPARNPLLREALPDHQSQPDGGLPGKRGGLYASGPRLPAGRVGRTSVRGHRAGGRGPEKLTPCHGPLPWQTRAPAAGAAVQPLARLRTIQKRVPVARATYCSMVDSTLKMRQTRTMRKLQGGKTRRSAPRPARPLHPPPRHKPRPGDWRGCPPPPAQWGHAPSLPPSQNSKCHPARGPPAGDQAHGAGCSQPAVKDEAGAPATAGQTPKHGRREATLTDHVSRDSVYVKCPPWEAHGHGRTTGAKSHLHTDPAGPQEGTSGGVTPELLGRGHGEAPVQTELQWRMGRGVRARLRSPPPGTATGGSPPRAGGRGTPTQVLCFPSPAAS